MIKYIALVVLLIVSCASLGDVSIVMKGRWTPVCSGVWISQHNRYDKALQAVINHNADCDIMPPNRIEVRFTAANTEPETFFRDIALSWDIPTEYEDGTALTKIDRFNIYYTFNGTLQDAIEVEATSVMYALADVAAGSHSFQISTVSNGVEGKKSDAVIVEILE